MKKLNNHFYRLMLLVFLLISVAELSAQYTIYTSRTAWESALAALPTNNANFSGVPASVDLCTTASVSAGSHTISALSGCGGGQSLFVQNSQIFFSGTTGGTPNIQVSIPTSVAVGFDWQTSATSPTGYHNSLYFKASFSTGSIDQLLNETSTSGFFGIISTCGNLNKYVLHSALTNWQQYYMSNFSCSTTPFTNNPATMPVIQSSANSVCAGSPAVFSVVGGSLNQATQWVWYKNSCGTNSGGTQVGTGNSITVYPTGSAVYYVRGEGGCVNPGPCNSTYISTTPIWYMDADGDGYTVGPSICSTSSPGTGYIPYSNGADCNDNNWAVRPNAAEILGNGIDDNCNGQIDELIYCTTSSYYVGCYAPITNVMVGSINNPSTCEPGGYGNYTAQSTTAMTGDVVSITVSHTFNGVAVYVDYNKDGDFTDAGEKVITHNSGATVFGSFTIPTSLTAGPRRLRVVSDYFPVSDPCLTAYGNIEDYTLNITVPAPTTDTTTASACGSYLWTDNNTTYTQSGVYTGQTVNGIIHILNLTITPLTSDTTTASACVNYTWLQNNQNYTSSGTYSVVDGCVTHVLMLTINPLPTVTTNSVIACPNSSVSLSGSPAGGTWSVANPYTGPQTSFTYSYTSPEGCTNTSTTETISFYTMLPPTGITVAESGVSAYVSWVPTNVLNTFAIRYRFLGGTSWTTVNATGTSTTITGLSICSNYELQMQTTCSGGSSSAWSNSINFSTNATPPSSAINATVNNTTCTTSWTAVPGAAYYGTRFRRTNPIGAWSNATTNAPNKLLTGLPRNACYEFQVQSFCAGSPTGSAWSVSKTFCTAAAAPLKTVNGSDDYAQTMSIYPNPVNQILNIDIPVTDTKDILIRMMDIHGRTVKTEKLKLDGEEVLHFQMDVTSLAEGLYIVQVYKDETCVQLSKLTIQR
ncbi:MAG: T9SS type A sorting domain-containing protein [Chitinophagaceae bacterium]|nr:T9SS type A sorting domain-containing protein [Chitinophagaceae bacterium]